MTTHKRLREGNLRVCFLQCLDERWVELLLIFRKNDFRFFASFHEIVLPSDDETSCTDRSDEEDDGDHHETTHRAATRSDRRCRKGFLGYERCLKLSLHSLLLYPILARASRKKLCISLWKYRYSSSERRRRAMPIATENSGPAVANCSARKAGVSSLLNGSA